MRPLSLFRRASSAARAPRAPFHLVSFFLDCRPQGRLGVLATDRESVGKHGDFDAVAVLLFPVDEFHAVRLMEVPIESSQLHGRILAILLGDVAFGVTD